MKNINKLTFLFLSLMILISCGGNDEPVTPPPTPKTFEQMFLELQTRKMTVTGKETLTFYGENDQTTSLVSNIKTSFGENSYHIEIEGEADELTSTVYTKDQDKVLHYYIDAMNTVQFEEIKYEDGTYYSWNEFSNPFMFLTVDDFIGVDDTTYALDKDLEDSDKKGINFTSALTYYTFLNPADNTSFIDEIYLKYDDLAISEIIIETTKITDMTGTFSYKFELGIDISETTVHETPLPTPLETLPHHIKLKEALTNTFNSLHKVDVVEYYDETMSYQYDNYILPNKGFQMIDIAYGVFYNFVQLEDGVHFALVEDDKTYADELFTDNTGAPYLTLNDFIEYLLVAVEWINYDEERDTYYLNESDAAGAFGYGLSPISFLSPQILASTDMELKLADDKTKIDSAIFTGSGCDITLNYTYEGFEFPFDTENILPLK